MSKLCCGFTTGRNASIFNDANRDMDVMPMDNVWSAWTGETGTSFDLNIDTGAAHIYELSGSAQLGYHNISRVVSIAGWSGTMYLELDFRAKSTSSTSTRTNAYVNFTDGSQSLGGVVLAAGGTLDTGWQHRLVDVSSIVAGRSSVTVKLSIRDQWST